MKVVQYNSGHLYGPKGQEIEIILDDKGHVYFEDSTRGICGVLTEKQCIGGADPGEPIVMPADSSDRDLQRKVESHYCGGYRYRSMWRRPSHLDKCCAGWPHSTAEIDTCKREAAEAAAVAAGPLVQSDMIGECTAMEGVYRLAFNLAYEKGLR